jgi:hypothetical protein
MSTDVATADTAEIEAPAAPAAAPPSSAVTRKRKKGAGRKSMVKLEAPEGGFTEPPSVPDEFDPEVHATLQRDQFADPLHYCMWRRAVYLHYVGDLDKEIEQLKTCPDAESRQALADVKKECSSLVATLKRMKSEKGADLQAIAKQLGLGDELSALLG